MAAQPTIKTLQNARKFVKREKMCTLFSGSAPGIASLWDNVDLPLEGGGNTRWGARVEAVWRWKNELPEKYPDEIFYGKIKGGLAALMTISHLRDDYYAAAHKPIGECSELAQAVYDVIRRTPGTTAQLRKCAIAELGCTKSRFETALKQLQVTLNVARLNTPHTTNDTWVPMREMYLDIVEAHEA
ncbi:MAG: hypothetical protein Aurels2KO_33840 [Aureliella sp.]